MSQGSNFSRVPMANQRRKFDDSGDFGGRKSGGKAKKSYRPDGKFDQHKEARRSGGATKYQDY